MKATGIVRRIDDLGRMVIPKEIRKTRGIDPKTPMEIFVDGDRIILRPYQAECIFCGEVEGVVDYKGKKICSECMKDLRSSKVETRS